MAFTLKKQKGGMKTEREKGRKLIEQITFNSKESVLRDTDLLNIVNI